MDKQIEKTLNTHFENNRVVFWYDDKKEFRQYFDDLNLPNITKIILQNNEFAVKYRVLREEPKQKFLLYQESARPSDLDNWLLDVLLSNIEFKTEQSALCLADLNLGYENLEITENHPEFFKSKERREKLKELVVPSEDTTSKIRLKMLAVCVKSDADIDSVMESLLEEYANGKEDKINLITRCKLDSFLYTVLKRKYNYESIKPSVKDFVLQLLSASYKNDVGVELKPEERFSNDGYVFLKRWKDSRSYEETFEKISNEIADILAIENDIDTRTIKELSECDVFLSIDKKILHSLTQSIFKRTISKDEVLSIIRQRNNTRWMGKYEVKTCYQALKYAALFMNEFVGDPQFESDSTNDAINKYVRCWHKIDQYYRKYVYFAKTTAFSNLLAELSEKIENTYSNKFLLKANDNWQQHVDRLEEWKSTQQTFFKTYVAPFENKNNKLFVIISDALRYEIGDELVSLIRQEDRYDAQITSAISCLPSYTQLGMAALMPNNELKITINQESSVKNAPVFVDGVCSAGKENRIKILQNYPNMRVTAYKAEDVLKKTSEELKAVVRESDVFFVYHNRIDYVGDKLESENRVFDETEDAIVELIKLVKKLAAANANNIIITADHGFIYQNKNLEESDYLGEEPQGTSILYTDRRFIIGKGLKDSNSFKMFDAKALGLADNFEYLFPKSINRLRKKGSGAKFVHGGISLQEVIVPIVQINKKRQSDTSKVDVEILKTNNIISSNQIAVKLYQMDAVNDKLQPRTLQIGIYNKNNDLISGLQEVIFDYTSENPRDREHVVTLILTNKVDEANGQEVKLKLQEQEAGTTHFKEYKSATYTVRKTFATDFDF